MNPVFRHMDEDIVYFIQWILWFSYFTKFFPINWYVLLYIENDHILIGFISIIFLDIDLVVFSFGLTKIDMIGDVEHMSCKQMLKTNWMSDAINIKIYPFRLYS